MSTHCKRNGTGAVEVNCDDLGAIRSDAEQALQRCRIDPARLGDAVLAVSELISNACEYRTGPTVSMSITDSGDVVTLEVTNEAPLASVGPPERWTLPDPRMSAGRGLAIVAAVSDAVKARWSEGRLTITAEFPKRREAHRRPNTGNHQGDNHARTRRNRRWR